MVLRKGADVVPFQSIVSIDANLFLQKTGKGKGRKLTAEFLAVPYSRILADHFRLDLLCHPNEQQPIGKLIRELGFSHSQFVTVGSCKALDDYARLSRPLELVLSKGTVDLLRSGGGIIRPDIVVADNLWDVRELFHSKYRIA